MAHAPRPSPSDFAARRATVVSVIERMRSKVRDLREVGANLRADDSVNVKGSLVLTRVDAVTGKEDVLVHDPNLVVALGRRVMSRLISGAVTSPTLLRTTLPMMRVIRDTTGSPTSAWVVFSQAAGTNNFTFELWSDLSGSAAYSVTFVGGSKTVDTLVAEINAVTGWHAASLNSLGSYDATALGLVDNAPALGTLASYTDGTMNTSPSARTMSGNVTGDLSVALADLYVSRMQFGTQGHDLTNTTIGKDVNAGDEQLTAALRPVDYGNAAITDDYLSVTVSYPNTSQVMFTASLSSSQGNGFSISEAALLTPSFMVARKNFGQIAKTNAFSITAAWTLLF